MRRLPALIALMLLAAPALAEEPLSAGWGDPLGLGGVSEEAVVETLSMTGTLIARTAEALTLRDGQGNEHRFRLTEHTRFVWGEHMNVRDLAIGASIRAVYVSQAQEQIATSVWLVAPPGMSARQR